MNYTQSRAEYAKAAARLYETGLQTGVGGNLSLRGPDGGGMLIKSSGSPMAAPVVTDWQGRVIAGEGKPSSEFFMHSEIYKLRPDCGGIVHAHCNWAVSWSLTGRDVPLITFTAKLKLPGPVPVIPVKNNNVGAGDFSMIAAHLADARVKAFILRGHGLVCLGSTLMDAVYHTELIEECAQIAWNASIMQRLGLLPDDFENFHGLQP